nr:nuclear transport factor 2 family protein [Moorena bouillonii]
MRLIIVHHNCDKRYQLSAFFITIRYTGLFSLLPTPYSLLPTPCSLLPAPCSLKAYNLYLTKFKTAILSMETKPPLPPFTLESATAKVQAAEDAWNTRNPEKVALAYTIDSEWRNRAEFISGREEIIAFLKRKWAKELDYRLRKRLWSFMDNRISVCFEYEWHDDSGFWYRAYGNENWEFAENGLMKRREASINDVPIKESERKFLWERSVIS